MPREKRHRFNLCGTDFETQADLEGHVERRHPKRDVRWWVVVEDPSTLPFEGEEHG